MTCYLCGSERFEPVPGKVRDRAEIPILRCQDCGLVFLGSFDHIHENFYDSDYTDENLARQNWDHYLHECRVDDQRRFQQIAPLITNKRFLDVGCGGGGVLLRSKDLAQEILGVEPQVRWRSVLNPGGVPTVASLAEVPAQSFDVVALFHVLEHIPDPVPFLREILSKAAPGGRIVIEVPNSEDALLSLYQNQAFSEFTYWSPHLFLYSSATLGRLFEKAGVSRSSFSITQFQRYPLSNHLMWLSKGRPGGHVAWSFLDSPALDAAYASSLAAMGRCDTLLAWINT